MPHHASLAHPRLREREREREERERERERETGRESERERERARPTQGDNLSSAVLIHRKLKPHEWTTNP